MGLLNTTTTIFGNECIAAKITAMAGNWRDSRPATHEADGHYWLQLLLDDTEWLVYTPGEPLVFQGGYHPRKKIHVIRVVFQDQTMYARTSFRVSKTC